MLMKLFTLALAGTALATPTQVYERDLPTITNALNAVQSAATALDSSVKSFSGASDIPGLQAAGAALLTAITTANSQISATAPLSLTDAIGLQSAASGLTDGTNTLINDVISQKPKFDAACISGAILQQLQQQKTASDTLSQTIVSKVPSAVQSIAQSQSGAVGDAVQKGINAYQGSSSSCASSGSGSGSSGASSAPAAGSSAPATSAPAASSAPATTSAAAAASSSAAAPPAGYGSASASASASGTPTKANSTPTPSGSSIVTYTGTGAAPHQAAATGFVGMAAAIAVIAAAL